MEPPPLPPWEGMHPIVVHFPIALLAVAPVLVALSLLVPGLRRGLAVAALAVMSMGTTGAVFATATGEATAEAVEHTPTGRAAEDLVEEHEELAETARNLFLALTAVYGALVLVPLVRGKEMTGRALWISHGVFLALYAGALPVLANVGHLGGRLVHEKGVHAPTAAPGTGSGGGAEVDGGRRRRGRGGDDRRDR